ncbi:hypothetical protein B7486_02200 [cyanobacterium TDX16]|nr:hypothetical protein B7486_02200 [cyanobacterium TDX16]
MGKKGRIIMCMFATHRTSLTIHIVAVLLLSATRSLMADTFRLTEGGVIEGKVVEESEDTLKVQTTLGIFEIEKSRIAERTKSESPWERYEKERKNSPDTAEGHFELAQWCRRQGLYTEQKKHLERVIELDPEHKKARAALGEVKQDGKWVKRAKPSSRAPSPEELEAMRQAKRDEKIVRKAIAEWHVKIAAIHRGRLEGEGWHSERFRDGRRQIMDITDPLAIPAITKVLSQGNPAARRLMVDALGQFKEDESTMNLIVVTVLDPSVTIRQMASTELIPRKDERVIDELRGALADEDEFVLRNAAAALGALKAREAIGDLIPLLSTLEKQRVRVTLPVFLDSVYGTFGCARRYRCGGGTVFYRPQYIGVIGPAYPMGDLSYYEDQIVSVHRTEVQEALIAITGQNFGFDEGAWRQWARQNKGG